MKWYSNGLKKENYESENHKNKTKIKITLEKRKSGKKLHTQSTSVKYVENKKINTVRH